MAFDAHALTGKEELRTKFITCTIVLLATEFIKNVFGFYDVLEIKSYCRERDRLITSDDMDEYLLVDVEIDSTLILECRFCEDKDLVQESKIWHWQDREQLGKITELALDMDNNITLNHFHMNADLSLTIKKFTLDDVGIYRCYGINGLEKENKYNYRLEPVFEDRSGFPYEGNLTEWEKYREINFLTTNERFEDSMMEEFVHIRDEGVVIEVITEWEPWGPCGVCVRKKGIRKRRGYCRVHRINNKAMQSNTKSDVVKFFLHSPMLPCRSRFLQERFPSVGNATRHLSEFILTEKCKRCKKEKKKKKRHKFKYKRRYLLDQGAHLVIQCPEATTDSVVIWRKDSLLLEKGKGHSFRKEDPVPRVIVDIFYTIYLNDVSEDEQGNYTCYVDKERMLQAKIFVQSKQGLLTEAFVRHFWYLTFILLITFFAYVVGIYKACKNKYRFRIQNYEQLKEEHESLLADT